jgi:hypothetical protein
VRAGQAFIAWLIEDTYDDEDIEIQDHREHAPELVNPRDHFYDRIYQDHPEWVPFLPTREDDPDGR